MTRHGQRALLLVLLLSSVVLLSRMTRPDPILGAPRAEPPCEVAIEIRDETGGTAWGVTCFSTEEARAAGLEAGDRIARGRLAGSPRAGWHATGRMSAARLELFEVPLDANRAPPDELASLPGIGPGLARRIDEARPFASIDEVRAVPGVGARRFQALRPRLRLGQRSP